MAFLDNIIGIDDIEERRQLADEAARARFDPNILNPQLEQASQIAEEGIADDQIRQQFLERILNQGNTSPSQLSQQVGSGRALSFLEKMNQQRGQQIGQAETSIALEEERAQREGESEQARLQTERGRIRSQREAKIRENRLMAEAEAERRKKQFGATFGKLAGIASMAIPGVGPLASAAIGTAAGGIGGGAEGALTAGITAGTRALEEKQPEPEQTRQQDLTELFTDRAISRILDQEAEEARPAVQKPEDEIISEDIDTSLPFNQNFFDMLMGGGGQFNLGF